MSAIQDQRDGPIPMAVEQGAPAAAKRELSPSSAHDASDAPSAKKAKQEDDGDGAFANGVADVRDDTTATAAAVCSDPVTHTEKQLALPPQKLEARADPTATAPSSMATTRESDQSARKIAEQLRRGQEERLKKAMKALAGDLQNVVKAVAAKEQAELKAVGLGISPQDLLSLANGGASGKGTGKAKAAAAAVCSAAAANAKSVGELLREPKCPTDEMPAHLLMYPGDTGDRHALMSWKKAVEKHKDKAERDRDAYVAKRKKELKALALKETAGATKALAEVCKKIELVEKAHSGVAKAQKELASVHERGSLLEETLRQKSRLALLPGFSEENVLAVAALDATLQKMEGKKLFEAVATVEREQQRDREKQLGKEQREAVRKAEKAERDRVKDAEKKGKAAQREAARLALLQKKDDAVKHKQRLAKYPVDDLDLKLEFELEAKEKGVSENSLGYKQLPVPTPVPYGPFLANEAALADFLNVFGEALRAPSKVSTVVGIRAVIVACGTDLVSLYRCLLKPCMELAVLGKGRDVTQWRRLVSDATWPEVVR